MFYKAYARNNMENIEGELHWHHGENWKGHSGNLGNNKWIRTWNKIVESKNRDCNKIGDSSST